MRVLIAEHGYARGALAAARALAAEGWTVGIASAAAGLAASSRSVSRWHRLPSQIEGLHPFVAALNTAIVDGRYEVVFGGGDAEVLALSEGRAAIRACVPYPSHGCVLRALDKLELTRAANAVGIAVPLTKLAGEIDVRLIDGPVIVKARIHEKLRGAAQEGERLEAVLARGRREAEGRISQHRAAGVDAILQVPVYGKLMALALVMDKNGGILGEVQQEAERVWPSVAGVSARAITVPIDASLREKARALLRDLGWYGLAELQFIVPPGGEPHLIDLNGRFYGSLALAVAAGVNMPVLWARMARGESPNPYTAPVVGTTYQWLEGDIRRACAERRGGIARDIGDCLRYARGATHSIWRLDDPWPAIRHGGRLLRRLARKALRDG